MVHFALLSRLHAGSASQIVNTAKLASTESGAEQNRHDYNPKF